LRYRSGAAELHIDSRRICRTRSTVRLLTSLDGTLQNAVGIAAEPATVKLKLATGHQPEFSLEPNRRINFGAALNPQRTLQ